jgi:hypothetical protein
LGSATAWVASGAAIAAATGCNVSAVCTVFSTDTRRSDSPKFRSTATAATTASGSAASIAAAWASAAALASSSTAIAAFSASGCATVALAVTSSVTWIFGSDAAGRSALSAACALLPRSAVSLADGRSLASACVGFSGTSSEAFLRALMLAPLADWALGSFCSTRARSTRWRSTGGRSLRGRSLCERSARASSRLENGLLPESFACRADAPAFGSGRISWSSVLTSMGGIPRTSCDPPCSASRGPTAKFLKRRKKFAC